MKLVESLIGWEVTVGQGYQLQFHPFRSERGMFFPVYGHSQDLAFQLTSRTLWCYDFFLNYAVYFAVVTGTGA